MRLPHASGAASEPPSKRGSPNQQRNALRDVPPLGARTHVNLCQGLRLKQGRWWKVIGSVLAAFALGGVGLDISDWVRLARGGGLVALVESLFFACGTVLLLRLTVSAFVHGWHRDPKPDPWWEAIFGTRS